jgi:sirohydrochlorin cobaltochelatase
VKKDKRAVILLGHGSRVKNAGDDMEKIASLLKARYGYPRVECAYMSRLGPHLPETIGRLVAEGQKNILVIPYFLHSGLHILLDIPEMMQREAETYPGIRLQMGPNLGFDEVLADLVHKRITQSLGVCDVRDVRLPRREEFPVPPGQPEFVAMLPGEAKKYARKVP